MESKLQYQIAFYITGGHQRSPLRPLNGQLRPALLARYRDLISLRYDFPLILSRGAAPERSLISLSRSVDAALERLRNDPDHDRLARHAYRMESELRRELKDHGSGDLASLWKTAADRLTNSEDQAVRDSLGRLWTALELSGDAIEFDAELPVKSVRHVWQAVQSEKAKQYRRKAERLLLKLRGILEAEKFSSAAGRSPERLQAGVGSSFAGVFDFEAMSRLLVEAKPNAELPAERRSRILGLINVLEHQRFYPSDTNGTEPYSFAFTSCSEALRAYRERHDEAVELVKTLAIAELEAKGDYRESVHGILFESFGANGLEISELAELPDYFISADAQTLDAGEMSQLIEILAAGLPVKILFQTNDVLEPSVVAEGHTALGLRARQLVNTAIGLTDVYVFQSAASHIVKTQDSLLRGMLYEGPALFSIFSGVNGHTGNIPAYLVAAAAIESRAFPALVYDPSAGSDWADRLDLSGNPHPEEDWATHPFLFEDQSLQACTEDITFTLADFMAMDDRFFGHFAVVPKEDWGETLIPVIGALRNEIPGVPEHAPNILMVDDQNRLQKALLDDRTLREVRRCRSMWHSLQELGGIHNSHAERLLARSGQEATDAASQKDQISLTIPVDEPTADPGKSVEPTVETVSHTDDPYIETTRCTSCNECIQLNGKLFAYNENKQAYINDPDAGTFRQLVEAAEGCQVSIIHPGKPRNPKEPGLDDLIRRAAEFNS